MVARPFYLIVNANYFSRRKSSVVHATARKKSEAPCPPVDLSGASGWTPFDAPALVGASLRFVSGDPEGNRFRVRYYRDGEQQLLAQVWFGPETEGPPGNAHGGSIAAVFDEVLGLAAWAAGYQIVVGNLNVSFRNLVPLQKVVTVESKVISAKGRKVIVHGRIYSGETVYGEGECLCITLPAT